MSKKWIDINDIFKDEYINNKYNYMMREVPSKNKKKINKKNIKKPK